MKPKILLMDNVSEFLDTQARLLEHAGYRVLRAATIADAEQVLSEDWVHLALLDIRMEDEDDEHDFSGLNLAEHARYRAVPKIILTAYPSYETAVEALGSLNGHPSAIDYVSKTKKPGFLIERVELALRQHVPINWQLNIEWNARDVYGLVRLIESGLDGERLLQRAEELTDLFRRLFSEKSHIRIERLLWQRGSQIALTVFAFNHGSAPEATVVVCGPTSHTTSKYEKPQPVGHTSTGPIANSVTTHFTARSYILEDADLAALTSLVDLYLAGPESAFKEVLAVLFEQTLSAWHQEQRLLDEVHTLDEIYGQRLDLNDEDLNHSTLAASVDDLIRVAPTMGIRIDRQAGQFVVRFDGQSLTYRDPLQAWEWTLPASQPPVILMNTPGQLTGENILVDEHAHVWLTDFEEAGPAPVLWNFVSLEAAVRFDWIEERRPSALHQLERNLITGDFSRLDPNDVEATLRRPVRTIQTIRKLAARAIGREGVHYHIGLFYHALARVAEYQPEHPALPGELARYVHALLAAAMLYDKLTESAEQTPTVSKLTHSGLRLDQSNHAVWLDDKRVPVRAQSYDLLYYLYEHPNQLRTRQEIIEQVFKEKFAEFDKAQDGRLNAAIRRLREKIEPEPDNPRYLVTEPGAGYVLKLT